MKLSLAACAHCTLCAESCFLFNARDNDPTYMPSYKFINSLGVLYKKKGGGGPGHPSGYAGRGVGSMRVVHQMLLSFWHRYSGDARLCQDHLSGARRLSRLRERANSRWIALNQKARQQ